MPTHLSDWGPRRFGHYHCLRAAIYCRLSEEDRNKLNPDDDSNSIQNQKTMLLQYALNQGWDVVDIYSDDDYTGSDRRRPEFNRLLKDAEAGKFDIVLCKTQSRFTRELELVEKYIHGLFPIWGIRFVSIVDNADSAVKGNKKARQINGLVNEWFLEDMSENIKAVLTSRRENGFHIGAFAPYGYKKDPDIKGHLIIDPEAADVVREIFTLFAQGRGKTAIARLLNDRGIPNPTEYKRRQGLRYQPAKGKNSGIWKYFAISDILCNQVYIGNLVQAKSGSVSYKTKVVKPRPKEEWIIVKRTHEAIIDIELWNHVQSMIADRAKPCYTGKIGLFAKKVRCAYCGYTMRSCKKDEDHRYLECSNRHVSKDSCDGAFISLTRLEEMVLQEINRLTEEFLDKDELEQRVEFSKNLTQRKAKIIIDINNFEKHIAEITKGLRELYKDKLKEIITEADYIELSRDFKTDRERIETNLKIAHAQLAEIEHQLEVGDNRKQILEKYAHMDHLTREVVDILIDYIVVYRRIPGTRNVPIEIHWKF